MMELTGGPADVLRQEEAGLLACVHCGFCLNACPTYRRLGHEADSPRGRLDLMRAVAEGRLPPEDAAFHHHIDQCLGCRACEPVCPSGVPYGFLLERARDTMAAATGVPITARLLIAAYTGPLTPVVTAASRLLRGSGLARALARILPAALAGPRFGLAMLAGSSPWPGLRSNAGRRHPSAAAAAGATAAGATPPPMAGTGDGSAVVTAAAADVATSPERALADPHALMAAYPSATSVPSVRQRTLTETADGGGRPPRIALLLGCVQQSLFDRVNGATARVLAVNGCDLVDVPGQRCCGALDAHSGRLSEAKALARANIAAFEAAGVDYVVVNAAGCGAILKEYGEQLRDDPEWAERAHAFAGRVRDVSEFLVAHGVRRGAPVEVRVTYDAPCHLHHGQRIVDAPLRLLDSVPGLERIPLPAAEECCGGAGLYGINHPGLGGRILSDKMEAIRSTGAAAVATPNPGCMMQIGAGLLLEGMDVGVVHPLEILDESYRRLREAE
ncbi:MAG TPA: heterodisulfide reductase-related iron-sulfur binding cluster [Longimicrobiales bacterium]|nr:heterodisulfide reductase-related iron-sulfur binding cluster [Longimicrobiales bacterium]